MHEHFTFAYPGWYADDGLAPYNREEAEAVCLKVLADVKKLGVKTIVDATAADVGGRDPILLRRLSEKSGVHIIAATGLFPESVGAGNYYKWQSTMRGRNLEEDLYELFSTELTVGIRGSAVTAGVIKVATGDDHSDYDTTGSCLPCRLRRKERFDHHPYGSCHGWSGSAGSVSGWAKHRGDDRTWNTGGHRPAPAQLASLASISV
jgi:hypothetical protein